VDLQPRCRSLYRGASNFKGAALAGRLREHRAAAHPVVIDAGPNNALGMQHYCALAYLTGICFKCWPQRKELFTLFDSDQNQKSKKVKVFRLAESQKESLSRGRIQLSSQKNKFQNAWSNFIGCQDYRVRSKIKRSLETVAPTRSRNFSLPFTWTTRKLERRQLALQIEKEIKVWVTTRWGRRNCDRRGIVAQFPVSQKN
jgi:hypothetical protein